MSSVASVESTAPSSIAPPRSGILVVTCSIKDKGLKESVLNKWYAEHTIDVLGCPGNGGLFLRYRNADKSVSSYADIDFARRFTTTDEAELIQCIKDSAWPFLALVKLSDIEWLKSQQFAALPHVSVELPKHEDGSLGSAFDVFHAGLRTYENAGEVEGASRNSEKGRAKFLVLVQTNNASDETLDNLDKELAALPKHRRTRRLELVPGYLQFEEPGVLPTGLLMYEYDGPDAPEIKPLKHEAVVRADIWGLTHEEGDKSLDM